MKRFIVLFLLTVALVKCAPYLVHPGSANTADSVAYDALRDAQAVIDTARPELASGALNANLKPLFNTLVKAYDVALPAWKAYHAAALAGATVDLVTLNKDLADLTAALAAFRKGK